jgi:hypothetical protein
VLFSREKAEVIGRYLVAWSTALFPSGRVENEADSQLDIVLWNIRRRIGRKKHCDQCLTARTLVRYGYHIPTTAAHP